MDNAIIYSIGTAVPPGSFSQKQAAIIARNWSATDEKVLSRLYAQSGIDKRHSVWASNQESSDCLVEGTTNQYGDNNCDTFRKFTSSTDFGPSLSTRMKIFEREGVRLAKRACLQAIAESPFREDQITDLIAVSCTGFSAPGISHILLSDLGLSPFTSRLDVGFMGCHAAINALRTANSIIRNDSDRLVLVVCTELCSLHCKYHPNGEQIVANSLFSDGAAALLIGSDTYKSKHSGLFELDQFNSMLLPDSKELMSWKIGDNSFEMGLSNTLPALIEANLLFFLENRLAKEPYGLKDIAHFAIHPGGKKILQAAENALKLSPDALHVSRFILSEYGNMSSATILFILKEMKQLNPNLKEPVLALAFGPGICIESAVLIGC
ncbi:MAG TPA: type III polyketide synthase [Oligoflexia bacterium]|nr:type III polyketide synthase [Oligoflexia bacterium]HMP49558.1 type III polyketide synthase [Oligoflexia bacterium]